MNSDPYNSPKKHQIANNPLIIKKTWASAFEQQTRKTDETRPEYQTIEVDTSNAIPNPNKKPRLV